MVNKQPQGLVLEFCKDLAKIIDEKTINMTSEQTDAYVNGLAKKMFMANSMQLEKK